MTEKTNIKIKAKSDLSIIGTISSFIKHHRLEQNKTQNQLAKEAGLTRTTVVDFEQGKSCNLLTFIQLLRTLNLLYIVEHFEIKQELSPILLAELEHGKRKRASKAKKVKRKPKSNW